MVWIATVVWVFGRNVEGIEAVAVRQSKAVIPPILICRMLVFMKKWYMSDALPTLRLTFATSVRMNGTSALTMSSQFRVGMISFPHCELGV